MMARACARLGHVGLQLAVDHLLVRHRHRLQFDRFHLCQAERVLLARRGQLRNTYPQADQAFLFADLIGVVYDPHPVGGLLLGPMQFVVPQTQQPQSHGRAMRNREVESPLHIHFVHPIQSAARSPQRHPPEDPAQHQEDLHQTELMARWNQLESWVRTGCNRRLGAGDCSTCCCNWARSRLVSCSRASALARHRSHERRRSRTSVRKALSRSCNVLYFAFQRSRLFSNARASTRQGLRYEVVSFGLSSE